ncbi:MAG: hypothetical protein QGH82_02075, partial [Candidatus Woesearchaeota archaeon]|nr:hypothetical protein [Candidatus Woesearchaeota archaeon]
PVPFVAAVREKITSEPVRHLRKDGTPYFKPKIAKKGSKLWYDPISKKTWTHENHHAMRVARGEAEVEGGKGTSPSATDIMYSTAHPDDGSAGRLDSGDAATRRTEDTPEGHEGKISDMSDSELDVLAAKVKSALKIKKAEKEAAAKTSGIGTKEENLPKTAGMQDARARMRARRKSIAKVMAESDPEARIPAILRKVAPVQARNDPSSFLSLYFRVTGKKQNDPDLATLVGAKGMKREGESKRWVMGTVPARYKGKASNEALEHFIPNNQKERHFMDRYKVRGFVSPKNEDGTPFTPVNFRDVQDDEIDISHLSPGFQELVKGVFGSGRMTVKDLETLIRNTDGEWPVFVEWAGRAEEMRATALHIRVLKTLFTLRHENYPGGIVHGEATRLQSFDQINEVFKSRPRLSQAIVEVMDHLTRKTGDTAPSFATMRADPEWSGAHQATDLRRATGDNPTKPADITINETVARLEPESNINTPFGATAHEMMHWAYHNVLNDHERLYFWENVVLPKGKEIMMEHGRVSNNLTNIGDGPGEYFANQAALYIEKNMPGALDKKWWQQVLGETVKVLNKILDLLDYKTLKLKGEYGGLDEHIVQILERILPDEFRAKLHEDATRRVTKDVKKYKWVYIGGKHGQRIIGRANAFDSVRHELQEVLDLDSEDIDAVPSAANNMAAH